MTPSSLQKKGGAFGRGRVLVFEDVPEDREALARTLQKGGYETILMEKPEELKVIANLRPRIVIVSADMPRGFNLCHALKKDRVLRQIPLIIVFKKQSQEVIRKHKMLPTRGDLYISKPIEEAAFLKVLDDLTQGLEETVGDLSDRTVVEHGVESAVVTFVEEEVSSLKSRMNSRIQSLEAQLAEERARLDAALQALAEQRASQRIEVEKLEAAREEGRREAEERAKREIERLQGALRDLQETYEATARALEAKEAEALQMTMLFEKLERGYKDQISALEIEKEALENALSEAEGNLLALKEECEKLRASLEELPALQEKAARCDILAEEVKSLREEKEALERKFEEVEARHSQELSSLKAEVEVLESRLEAETELRRQAEAKVEELRAENESLRGILVQLRNILDRGPQ